jgi:hypothetical protein
MPLGGSIAIHAMYNKKRNKNKRQKHGLLEHLNALYLPHAQLTQGKTSH